MGSGLARGTCRPLIVYESSARMRNEEWWCGAKNNKAPRSINRAMPEGFFQSRFPVSDFQTSTAGPRMTKISRLRSK